MLIRFSEWPNEVLIAYKSSSSFSDNPTDKGKIKKQTRIVDKLITLLSNLKMLGSFNISSICNN